MVPGHSDPCRPRESWAQPGGETQVEGPHGTRRSQVSLGRPAGPAYEGGAWAGEGRPESQAGWGERPVPGGERKAPVCPSWVLTCRPRGPKLSREGPLGTPET